MNPDYTSAVQQMGQANLEEQKSQQEQQDKSRRTEELKASIQEVSDKVSQAIDRKSSISIDNLPTSIHTPDIYDLIEEVTLLRNELYDKDIEDHTTHELLDELIKAVKALPTENQEINIPEQKEEVKVTNLKDYSDKFDDVIKAVQAIKTEFNPEITVSPAEVKVENDYSKLEQKMDMLLAAVKAISIVVPEQDDSKVISAVKNVSKAISELRFPVSNYVLPFKTSAGESARALVDNSGYSLHGGKLVPERYDSIAAAYPNSTTETYTYKLSTDTVAVITVVYTDSTKANISTVTRT